MYNVLMLSGGKDSLATWLLIRNCKYNICLDEIVFTDSCNESLIIYDYIDIVKDWCIDNNIKFSVYKKDILSLVDNHKYLCGGIYRYGTTLKCDCSKYYSNCCLILGIAYDEQSRLKDFNTDKDPEFFKYNCFKMSILNELKMTELDALNYCYENGFDYGGLYKDFKRVSCLMCQWRILRFVKYPYLQSKYKADWDFICSHMTKLKWWQIYHIDLFCSEKNKTNYLEKVRK